jgi:hypothetical protein
MTATLVTASKILKEIYEPKITEWLQNHLKTSKRIEQTSEGVKSEVGGKFVVFAVHTKRNHGIGARLEMERLPAPGAQGYARGEVKLAHLYGSIRLSGQAMKLAKTNYQAFASVLDEEVNGIQRDLAKDMNRQIYGTSVGALATASGANTGNVIPSTNTQYLEVGMIVDMYSSNGATVRFAGRTVTAVDKNTSFTVDGATLGVAAISSGDILTREGNLNKEIVGFQQIVNDTGTLFNINPVEEPLWKSVMNRNGGTNRALSESLMTKMVDDVYTEGGNTTAIFTTLGIRRAYFNLLQQQRRYTEPKKFSGGFEALAFMTDTGDVPLVSDVDCQPNRMYFMNEKALRIYRESDWSFMDEDGSKWARVEGFDAYDATLYKYCNFGTNRRNTHGLIEDVIEA